MSDLLTRSKTSSCQYHNSPQELLCVESYCAGASRVLCRKCIQDHEHHLLISMSQATQIAETLLTTKRKAQETMESQIKSIQSLRTSVCQQLSELEKIIKNAIDSIRTQEAMDQVVFQYLKKIETQLDSNFEYNYIALYLSTIARRDNKEIHLESHYNVISEISDYLLKLVMNVDSKLSILIAKAQDKPKEKVLRLKQYNHLNTSSPAIEIRNDFKYVTPIFVERPSFLVGFLLPKISTISEEQEQTLVFSLHKGTDLTHSLYFHEFTINHRQQIIDDCYQIYLEKVKLEIYQEYTLSLSAKNKPFFMNTFTKAVAANQYIQFTQKFDNKFKLPDTLQGVIQNKGLIPTLIIELDE